MTPSPRVLGILGPTASGKTALAVEVARRLGGEIISADSRQAYRGLEIGTAAPGPEERAAVPHHGVAFLEPGERYGAGRFARLSRGWIRDIEARGRVPLVTGGTGFFVRALIRPVFREPHLDAGRRERLEEWLAGRPTREVRRWTRRLDPGLDSRLAVIDPQRAVRALELSLLTGRSLTWWQENAPPEAAPVAVRLWVLEADAGTLRSRIRERAERMIDRGWTAEVEALAARGYGPESRPMTAVGYRTILRLSRGEISREEAVTAIVRDTWQYARRQRTWFRHQLGDEAVRVRADADREALADRIARDWRRRTAG